MVKLTKPNASITMFRMLRWNSRHEVWNAARNSSGGRITRKTMFGSSETRGACGNKLRNRPPITMTIGYAICSRLARIASADTNRRSSSKRGSTLPMAESCMILTMMAKA